jgi:hypothetical protein
MFVNHRLFLSRDTNLERNLKKRYPTRKMWIPNLSVDSLEKKKTKLYRYMSFDKFKKLMTEHTLFFARAREFYDKFEAGFQFKKFAKEFLKYRDHTFISCWTTKNPLSKSSLCMWKPNDGNENLVAIEVSIDKFLSEDYTSCFLQEEYFERIEPYIGMIDYLKPEDDDYTEIYEPSILTPFFLKRIGFAYEEEIRILIQDMDRKGVFPFNVGNESKGIPVFIDLKKIDNFFVSSTANDVIFKEINDLIKKAGFNKTGKRVSIQNADYNKVNEKLEFISKYNNKLPDTIENSYKLKVRKKDYIFVRDASGNAIANMDFEVESVDIIIQSSQYHNNDLPCHRLTKFALYPFSYDSFS